MLTEVRKILNEVEDILLRNDSAAKDLWSILTALRGPDNGDRELKMKTTARVRGVAFPKLLAQRQQTGYNSGYCNIADGEPETSSLTTDGHFESHIGSVVVAIKRLDQNQW